MRFHSYLWPGHLRYLPIALWVVGCWLGVLLLLFVLGSLLSDATLRAARRMTGQATGASRGFESTLRALYSGLIRFSCLIYWFSIPLVALLVVALGGGLIFRIFALGNDRPFQIAALIVLTAFLVLATLAAMVRGLFVRRRDGSPGLRIAQDREPRLTSLLREVAGKIGTRPVDTIYITPGTDLAVMERGGLFAQFRGSAERCLILGGGLLEGLKIGPFKSILAHEYGHFSNRDTAGGGLALAVRRSLLATAGHLVEHEVAVKFNPAWLFLVGFQKIFLRISQGASRLQEVLADRQAAFAYGTQSFEAGQLHVTRRSIQFQAHAQATLREVIQEKRSLANLYSYQPSVPRDEAKIEAEMKRAIHREPSPYDSHPSPVRRILWVKALNVEVVPTDDDENPVWSLFLDREAIEQRLTAAVRADVAMQGFAISKKAGGSATPDPPAVSP